MRVSVVIPTYKRPQSLARCLDALERQLRPAQEMLVVFACGDLASQEVVRARGSRYGSCWWSARVWWRR